MIHKLVKVIAALEIITGLVSGIIAVNFVLHPVVESFNINLPIETMVFIAITLSSVFAYFLVFAGIRLWRGDRFGYRLSCVLQLLQIPVIILSDFTYRFSAGVVSTILIGTEQNHNHLYFSLENMADFVLFPGSSVGVGFNLLPFLMFIFLLNCRNDIDKKLENAKIIDTKNTFSIKKMSLASILVALISAIEMVGGVLGMIKSVLGLLVPGNQILYYVIVGSFLFLYGVCLYAGVQLWKKTLLGYKLSIFVQAFQIPFMVSQYFGYSFESGVSFYHIMGQLNIENTLLLGSSFHLDLYHPGIPFGMGINSIALAAFVFLVYFWCSRYRMKASLAG